MNFLILRTVKNVFSFKRLHERRQFHLEIFPSELTFELYIELKVGAKATEYICMYNSGSVLANDVNSKPVYCIFN